MKNLLLFCLLLLAFSFGFAYLAANDTTTMMCIWYGGASLSTGVVGVIFLGVAGAEM